MSEVKVKDVVDVVLEGAQDDGKDFYITGLTVVKCDPRRMILVAPDVVTREVGPYGPFVRRRRFYMHPVEPGTRLKVLHQDKEFSGEVTRGYGRRLSLTLDEEVKGE